MTTAVRALGAAELLRLWECAQGLPAHEQALELLRVAYPDSSCDTLAALPIGARDDRLLELRERLFGPRLTGLVDCPGCGERVELAFRVDEIRAAGRDGSGEATETGSMVFEEAGWRIEYRLPTGADLAEVAGGDLHAARARLLRACVLRMSREGAMPADPDLTVLPDAVAERLVEHMSEADPRADVELAMSCPTCGHAWLAPFDIVSYLAGELDAWAQRILIDVARLARGYGWREADILAMSATRRRAYLELLEGL